MSLLKSLRVFPVVFMISSMTLFAGDIVQIAEKAGKFKILVTALGEADLVDALKSEGPLTVLAPTDEAFGQLPKGTLEDLLKPANKEKLISILKYHVIAGKVKARDIAGLDSAETLSGQTVSINIKDGRLVVNKSKVIGSDIEASNGIIHVIDSVLLPPEPKTAKEEMLSLIEEAIESGAPLYNKGQTEACAKIYKITAKAILVLGASELNQEVKSDLKKTLKKVDKTDNYSTNAWSLRSTLDKTYKYLQTEEKHIETGSSEPTMPAGKNQNEFKVLLEADLPAGFPQPGPLNKIVVKEYPQYRAAKVGGANMQNAAFMRLFTHIKRNGISMTAPVEMGIDGDSAKRQSMAFLYGNQNIGKTGSESGGVEVVDLPAQKYVSIGFNGSETNSAIKKAINKLEDWLKINKDTIAVGEPRLLGYNSPMVPSSKRFWEVQIPVKVLN